MTAEVAELDFTRAAAALSTAEGVVIVCHIRPDADTVGSALALALALERNGIRVRVAYPSEWELPAALAELPGHRFLTASDELVHTNGDVVVAVDCASLERLGELAQIFDDAASTVVIDHHASNPGFGSVRLIDPAADSSAEVVLRLVDALGVEVDIDIATCVFAGLVTDTGSFRWARPPAFEVAARLLALGVDGPGWTRRLLDTHPFGWLEMVSRALSNAVLVAGAFGGAGLVYTVVPYADLADVSWEEVESIVDIVRTVAEAEVAAVFKEGVPGRWTVSLRSKCRIDLVPLAERHGGGGHPSAAGYNVDGSAATVVKRLLNSV